MIRIANTLKLPALALLLLLAGCTTSTVSEYGNIDWTISNGTGAAMTVVVFDKVCNRSYFRVQVDRTGYTEMNTCQNASGRAEIRYRRAGRIADGNPWFDTTMSENQNLIVR